VKVEWTLAEFLCQKVERLPYRNVLRDIQDVADERIPLRPRRIWWPAPILLPFPDQSQRCGGTKRRRKQGFLVGHVERFGGQRVVGFIRPALDLYPVGEQEYGGTMPPSPVEK